MATIPLKLKSFLVILFVGACVYGNTLANGFIWDDHLVVVPNEFIKDFSHIKDIFTTEVHHFSREHSNFYRPLQILSYTTDYYFWQLRPMGYHLTSALLHIANAFLVYLVFNLVLVKGGGNDPASCQRLGLATAVLWLVHPIHTQCTSYISGRADLWAVMFMLLTIYCHLDEKKKIWAVAAFAGALLSKELALLTPLLLVLVDHFAGRMIISSIKRYLPYLILIGLYIILRLTALHFATAVSSEAIPSLLPRIMTGAWAITSLIGVLIFPVHLSMSRNIPWIHSPFDLRVIFSLALIALLMMVAVKGYRKRSTVAFGISWFFLGILPVWNIFAMNANVSEHWMYLPSAGLIFAMVALLHGLTRRGEPRIFWFTISLLAVLLGTRLIVRNLDFRSEEVMYQKIIAYNPANARAHYNLGTVYANENRLSEALTHFQKAAQLKPDYAAAYGNIGQIHSLRGEHAEAITYLEKADHLDNSLIENHVNLGRTYAELGKYDLAITHYQRALDLQPRNTGALNGLGIENGRSGNFKEAERLFKEALAIDPQFAPARANLDYLYQLIQGTP